MGSTIPVAAINQDPETIFRGHNDVTLPIKGDPKRILGMLLEVFAKKRMGERAAKAEESMHARRQWKEGDLRQRRESQLAQHGITMAKFASMLESRMKFMPQRPVIFNEALIGGVGLADHIGNVDIPGMYFDTSGGSLGEWAGAVGAAMITGPTIAFMGDGGFNYAPQALWNAAYNNLSLGLVVANNAKYGLLYENLHAAIEGRGIDTKSIPIPHFFELADIDYVKIVSLRHRSLHSHRGL